MYECFTSDYSRPIGGRVQPIGGRVRPIGGRVRPIGVQGRQITDQECCHVANSPLICIWVTQLTTK